MLLINTRTLELEESSGYPAHTYAILSHTWGKAEVTLQQYRAWRSTHSQYFAKDGGSAQNSSVVPPELALLDRVKRGASLTSSEQTQNQGMLKILRCADRALHDGIRYIWVDTCCIDKTSSAELQEAINSMFRWYKESKICYAYLSDVDMLSIESNNFEDSRWFSRGWTLQELLAPRGILFFDMNWKELGQKSQLFYIIEKRTGIDGAYLKDGSDNLQQASIATRMSWAANRETTRKEDMAYCLLGIFGIHMPMLYGEGDRAFRRLQMEIIKISGDSSIMAWDYSGTWVPASYVKLDYTSRALRTIVEPSGLLASSPSQYTNCQHVIKSETGSYDTSMSFSMSQHGLELEARVSVDPTQPRLFYVALGCWLFSSSGYNELVLPLLFANERVGSEKGILAWRELWMTPMAVTGGFTVEWQVAKIRIVPANLPDEKLGLTLNWGLFDKEWDFIGMYPPGPDVLFIHPRNYGFTYHQSEPLRECPWEMAAPTIKRMFCWKRRHDDVRMVVILDITQAKNSRCAKLAHNDDPRKGWCWVARLDRPFNLECAQRLLSDEQYFSSLCLHPSSQRMKSLCRDILSETIERHGFIFPELDETASKASLRITDVDRLL